MGESSLHFFIAHFWTPGNNKKLSGGPVWFSSEAAIFMRFQYFLKRKCGMFKVYHLSGMKSFPLLAMLLFCLAFHLPAQEPTSNVQTINPIIGDESFVDRFGTHPNESTSNELRIRVHLQYAEQILREKDVSELSEETLQLRSHVLDLLHHYWKKGVFPRNYDYPGERKPCFIDRDGRICAVGYLVEQTTGREVAEYINEKFQYEELMTMSDPVLDEWIKNNGFTKEEMATIQPTYSNDLWFAKRKSIGLRGGISCNNVVASPSAAATKSQPGFSGGITSEYRFRNPFSCHFDVLYEQRGFNSETTLSDGNGTATGNITMEYHYNYISLPLRVGIHKGERVYGFGTIGIIPSALLQAYRVVPVFDNQGNQSEPLRVDVKDAADPFDLAGALQFGAGYKFLNQRLWVFSTLEVQRSFTALNNDPIFPSSSMHTWSKGINLGVKFGW